jgi:hypothetical protein
MIPYYGMRGLAEGPNMGITTWSQSRSPPAKIHVFGTHFSTSLHQNIASLWRAKNFACGAKD